MELYDSCYTCANNKQIHTSEYFDNIIVNLLLSHGIIIIVIIIFW